MKIKCPCHSGKEYENCCAPFHRGKLPTSAIELMRSRFSAYSLGNSDYIIETTHPNHVDQSIPLEERKAQIKAFSAHTKFKNLEILNSVEGSIVSFVTFRATLYQKDRDCSFTEKSCFEKVGEKLYYLSGTID